MFTLLTPCIPLPLGHQFSAEACFAAQVTPHPSARPVSRGSRTDQRGVIRLDIQNHAGADPHIQLFAGPCRNNDSPALLHSKGDGCRCTHFAFP